MKKIKVFKNAKKVLVLPCVLVMVATSSGCKSNKKEISIVPSASLVKLYDAVDSYTSMDEYVDKNIRTSYFDDTDLDNLENEDMATVNKRIFNVGLLQLKGMILDSIGFPIEMVKDIKFNAEAYEATIVFGDNNKSIIIKISGKNIGNFVSVITEAQSGCIRESNVARAYNTVKKATLMTGVFNSKNNKVTFEYDEEKIEKVKNIGLVK